MNKPNSTKIEISITRHRKTISRILSYLDYKKWIYKGWIITSIDYSNAVESNFYTVTVIINAQKIQKEINEGTNIHKEI